MSDLVGNPEDRFSRVAAQFIKGVVQSKSIKHFFVELSFIFCLEISQKAFSTSFNLDLSTGKPNLR